MAENKYQGISVERDIYLAANSDIKPQQSDGFEIIYVEKGEIRIGSDMAKQGEMILVNPKQKYVIEVLSEKAETASFKIDMVKIWENKDNNLKNISNEYIRNAIDYMEENLKNVTAMDMAEYVGVSYTYFLKLFKDVTGCNFVKFAHNKRIQKSQMLLLDTNKNLDKIAQEVGFSTTSHFIKVFKSYTGMTPSAYRRRTWCGKLK